jgi:NADPH-dependent 2,4-dienoyl-CoA reductase/sulfur reductase-like enzyme
MLMPSDANFRFDGAPVGIRDGQSVAAALTEAGHRHFRDTVKGAARGMFCGMGVCQDCLVTIDGVPNRRACMTLAKPGMTIDTQVALAPLDGPALPAAPPARVIAPDVLVIGGGAGGLNAAIAAANAGASVIVLDERKVAGGQYFKQAAAGLTPLDAQQAEGQALVQAALDAGVEILGGVEIWGAFDGPLFLAEHDGAALVARPRSAIIATGAYERPAMVPGWTLPGVMTTGAAQTLWRSYRTLPGKRVAVCGSGPLNLQVALELAKGGAEVVMVAESAASPLTKPVAALSLFRHDAGLAIKGIKMHAGLRRAGVAVRFATELHSVSDSNGGLRVVFRSKEDEQAVTVDALCMNAGFEPQNEILRLLGAKMRYDPAFGHLRCDRDAAMLTSVAGIYAIGDCAGLGGAPAAAVEGRIAGRAAAGVAPDPVWHKELQQHRAFQKALWGFYHPGPRPLQTVPADTVICRCEEITAGDIRGSLDDKPGHAGTLKRATRVGMGRCQGRYCGPVAARLVADQTGKSLDDHSYFAPRVPIKPVSIAAILAAQEALDGGQ